MSLTTQERIARSLARERAEKARLEADPDGRAAHASGRSLAPSQWNHTPRQEPEATPEPEPAPVIETPANSITLEAEVEKNGRKIGIGNGARLGNLEMKLKQGGTIHGTLNLQYLNAPLFDGLSKLRKDGSNRSRQFKVTISIEEA